MSNSSPVLHSRDFIPRPAWLVKWEKHRHTNLHWLMELFAEALGVFFYVYAGVGSTAAYILGGFVGIPGVGSVLQIGLGYAFGIVMAITVCSSTSGGHFNPCVTVAFIAYKKFPPLKGLRYIVAQIFGGYIACLLIYAQYKDLINEVEAGLAAKGILQAVQFTPQGPAGIFALYVAPGSNLGHVLLNEFVTDTMLALVIWACIDHTNFLVPPAAGPWLVAFAYAVAIWGFSPPGLAANSARDLGGRLMAITIWGTKAAGGNYAALSALTNIPATLLGATLYELFLTDSSRVVTEPHLEFIMGHAHHLKERGAENKTLPVFNKADEKSHLDTYEQGQSPPPKGSM